MRRAKNKLNRPRPRQDSGAVLLGVILVLSLATAYAQEPSQAQKNDQALQNCASNLGWQACTGGRQNAIPNVVNDLWNAIAFSPSHNIAAFAGSFTAPENAKAAALKGCAARASDCRIIAAAHDICLAVAFERAAGGAYRWASAGSKQDAEGKALSVCMKEGPQRCAVIAGCSRQPPQLLVSG
jgi:hypothetical protein